MLSAGSNRRDPEFVKYYQNFADILGIWWQFHKERVASENIPFALHYTSEFHRVPFDPTQIIKKSTHPHEVIKEFSDATFSSMKLSWHDFLDELEMFPEEEPNAKRSEISSEQKRFFTPYTQQLAHETDGQARIYSRAVIHDGDPLRETGIAGIITGTAVTGQLAAVFGETFNPRSAVMLSKIQLGKIPTARNEIGVGTDVSKGYSLFDDSPLGLDRARLRELGLGDTLGCVAAMRVSPTAEGFLRSNGVVLGRETMLEEFATMVSGEFTRSVGEWYSRLSPAERQTYIVPEENSILNGEIRRGITGNSPHCPHRKER